MSNYLKNDGYYHHMGGGTDLLMGRDGSQYPSDDHWQRADGAEIIAHSTTDAHFAMPPNLKSAADLRRLAGVGKVTTLRPGASEQTRDKANKKP